MQILGPPQTFPGEGGGPWNLHVAQELLGHCWKEQGMRRLYRKTQCSVRRSPAGSPLLLPGTLLSLRLPLVPGELAQPHNRRTWKYAGFMSPGPPPLTRREVCEVTQLPSLQRGILLTLFHVVVPMEVGSSPHLGFLPAFTSTPTHCCASGTTS